MECLGRGEGEGGGGRGEGEGVLNTRIAELGVAKKGESIFFSFFFQKHFLRNLIFFSKKNKICDILSQLGNARGKRIL